MNIEYKIYKPKDLSNKDLNQIHKIIINNYNEINHKDNSDDEMYKEWLNVILNAKNYYFLNCYYQDEIIAFIAFMYIDIGLLLSEVQIKKEYQGKYDILRKMLKQVIDKSDKRLYSDVYGTISSKNLKSQNVFKHIGFENTKGILYKININTLMNWINRSK